MKAETYNQGNSCGKDATATHNRVSGGSASAKVPDSAQKWQAGQAPTVSDFRSRRSWRRQFGRFVAGECGVLFVPDALQYDPKRAEKRVEKRERLEDSDIRQCERFLQELIERPTIDPDQEAPVVIQGENIPALKAAILQGLARASQPPEVRTSDPKLSRGGK